MERCFSAPCSIRAFLSILPLALAAMQVRTSFGWVVGWSEYDMAWKSAVGFRWGEEESAELYAVHGYPGPGRERVSPGTWPAVMFLALF